MQILQVIPKLHPDGQEGLRRGRARGRADPEKREQSYPGSSGLNQMGKRGVLTAEKEWVPL